MKLTDIHKLVINLPERKDRLAIFNEELKYIGNPEYTIIQGVKHKQPHRGIGKAHINCINYARENSLPYVLIMEDDVRFQAKENTLDYINECLNNLPNDWEVLLGGAYMAKRLIPYNDHWNKITEFCGLHFYIVKASAYDKVMTYDYSTHIDRWYNANSRLNCYVAKKFFATQYVGFSDNVGRKVSYEYVLKKFDILK